MGRIAFTMPPVDHPLHGELAEEHLLWVLQSPVRRTALNLRDVVDGQRKYLVSEPGATSVNALAITTESRFVMLEISRAKVAQLWDFGDVSDVASGS